MKRWAVLTVLLYGLALLLLSIPVIHWAASDWEITNGLERIPDSDSINLKELYQEWGFWLWLGIMLAGQALLLVVPMDIARERPVSRRKVMVPVVVSAFFAANLLFAGIFCLLFMQFGDEAPDKILFWTNYGVAEGVDNPIQEGASEFFGITLSDSDRIMLGAISILLSLWVIWAFIFYRFARQTSSQAAVRRMMRWLLAGSILEFLVAVPSHIIVRGRGDCCAPAGTFWGIACGLAVMLLAFGPGVFFLFVERFRRLRPRIDDRPPAG